MSIKKMAMKWAGFIEQRASTMFFLRFTLVGIALIGIGTYHYIVSEQLVDLVLAFLGVIITFQAFERYGFSERLKELRTENEQNLNFDDN